MQFVAPFEIDPDAPNTGAESGDIAKALATLVEEQRAVLLLVLEALSYREVAEIQGVPIGTVMSRLATPAPTQELFSRACNATGKIIGASRDNDHDRSKDLCYLRR
jgi:RNA polymerase sigma-70 factor (ECF subfamily)